MTSLQQQTIDTKGDDWNQFPWEFTVHVLKKPGGDSLYIFGWQLFPLKLWKPYPKPNHFQLILQPYTSNPYPLPHLLLLQLYDSKCGKPNGNRTVDYVTAMVF